VNSFGDIATKEKKVERHIRLLAPLAFVGSSIVQSIIDGTAPAQTLARKRHGRPFSRDFKSPFPTR
jgi:hypothetical protein